MIKVIVIFGLAAVIFELAEFIRLAAFQEDLREERDLSARSKTKNATANHDRR